MITAGFPCQDISVANPGGKGLKGKRSGLFKEILRIVDALPSVQLVFLENSSRILKVGFKSLKSAMVHRGFVVRYTLARASDVGALHKRLRWYCLCHRPNALLPSLSVSLSLSRPKQWPSSGRATGTPCGRTNALWSHKWSRASRLAKVKRIANARHKAALVSRCKMLGNSVVPQVVRHAWDVLVAAAPLGALVKVNTDGLVEFPTLATANTQGKGKGKGNGKGKGKGNGKKQEKLMFSDGRRKITKHMWATPVHSVWHNYTRLTDRGSRLLSNQTFYFEGRIPRSMYNMYTANPLFVECLMGYPSGYTGLPRDAQGQGSYTLASEYCYSIIIQ
jgi:DNA (cytosine-5)-methyltransferase 1